MNLALGCPQDASRSMRSTPDIAVFLPRARLAASIGHMPLLQIQSSAPSSARASSELLKTLSADIARELHKPESYVMVQISTVTEMLFGGTSEPACFALLKNIGSFEAAQTERLSALLCRRLSEGLGVAPSRIYVEFVDAKGYLWGHDGTTFG
jgi:phenylpyruvate tautomerase